MKRTLTVVGAAVIAVVGAVAISQAQGRQGPLGVAEQRGGRPAIGQGLGPGMDRFECGPLRGENRMGPGIEPGRGDQRGSQGAMRGRGPGGGRQDGLGRPGGSGGPGRMGGRGFALCGLGLTEDQRAQIETIRQKSRDEVETVLTPEQKEQLRARRSGR